MGRDAPSLETPLGLIGQEGRRRVLLAVDAAARRQGLKVGMPASKAQALVSGLVVHDADPKADLGALERLCIWMQRRYSPLIAPDAPHGLQLDITGCAHLFGGEKELLKEIIRRLAEANIDARAACAPSYGAAFALARCVANPLYVMSAEQVAKTLELLPITALRLPVETIAALKQVGLERIGELNATSRAPLTLRFGPLVGERLDHAYGRRNEPFDPHFPPDILFVRRNFAEPIGAAETISRYTAQLTQQLSERLEIKGLGARTLDLFFYRVDNRIQTIRCGTAKPVRDAKRLAKLLCDKIEGIDPGFGIETMILAATLTEPLQYRLVASGLAEPPSADVSALVDTLTSRIGSDHVYRLAAVESDVPERAVKRVAPLAAPSGVNWPPHWPRPSRLLDPPEQIETIALLPDHPPVSFTWRGSRRRVSRADGPERLFGEWWKSDNERLSVRDYFQVEDDLGERFWLFRAGDGEDPYTGSHAWFVHGIFA